MELEIPYEEILLQAVTEIQNARVKIAKQVNVATNGVYWNLGKILFEKKIEKGHGAAVVKRLSADLKAEFPDMGLSPRNLWDMKRFYERYKDVDPKLRQTVAVLPWGHNLLLLNKISDNEAVYFYAKKAISQGWSRDILLNYLKADTFNLEKKLPKLYNFKETLPEYLAEQANDMLKSTYNLGFLGLIKSVREKKLESRLVDKIKHFVLEMSKGYTFTGSQH